MSEETEYRIYTATQLRAARKKGRKEAEEYLQERINNIIIANNNLLKEIMRIDREFPVTGVLITYSFADKLFRKLKKGPDKSVAIPLTTIEKIIKLLKKKRIYNYAKELSGHVKSDKPNPDYANRLKEFMDQANPIDMDKEEVLRLIEEIK